ncbi:hypothetical protein [Streptomyces sp. NPDC046332]|uniref:hypothetical protein n=1 Tax=unclassified Streptomyces TaxID=2593676 RepID=UPI0033EC0175
MSIQHIAEQRRAFEAALTLAKSHPGLPTVYTTVHTSGNLVDFRLDTLSGWEAWRDALGVDPAEVQVTRLGTHDLLLSVDTMAAGVAVHVYVIDQIRSVVREQAEEAVRAARQSEGTPPSGDPIAYGPTGIRCGCGKDAHSNLVPCRQQEDPHNGPNHHDYELGRDDLPFIPEQRDRWAV